MNDTQSQPPIADHRAYKRKKRLMWTLRWGIALALYITFWHVNWVKWTLMITVPIALYCLHVVIFDIEE